LIRSIRVPPVLHFPVNADLADIMDVMGHRLD